METDRQAKPYAIIPNCETRAMEGIIGSLGRRGMPLIGLSTDPKCTAFHSKFLTQKLISPEPKDEARFISYLVEKVPKGVLLTSNDQTAVLFARHEGLLRQHGFLLNVPPLEKLLDGFDKWQCYLNAKRLGIPTAETLLINSREEALAAADRLGFPHIIKATRLAGGNYKRINTPEEVLPAFDQMQALVTSPQNLVMDASLIAQKWLNYEVENIWCVESYYDTQGKARGFWPIRKWRTVIYKDGTFGSRLYAGECVEQPELTELSRKLLDGLEWRGFAHLDWVYLPQEKTFSLTEINPRLPGFSFFPSNAGFEMAYFYYADLVGEDFEVPSLKRSVYFETLRHPGDLTSTFVACFKKQYDFRTFFTSYANSIFSSKPIVIDFFDKNEKNMTWNNFLKILMGTASELKKIFKR
ncbi:hypothetical protein [Geoalkalibacter halelectricus]|uniref:ATP-grasp domain-containing protein n=1 Tax=Geoalkalibacter halelectricus TaxID=2847045 RepID=A0ABY5ZNK8_9BACT|nr:hypothetical protein [Geoalkalibacter halelectricus]MDO3379746.1 hypothetical protein [Geoalkalibacter halelectricus]UWZ79279.1 hypothetical protein L9S41_16590 [Geoalkalibacter halelectricus]